MPKHWVSALFMKFNDRYPNVWAAGIAGREAAVIEEWADGMAGMTGDQVKRGLDSWDGDMPPSLPAFKKACLGITGRGKNEYGLDYVPEVYRPKAQPITDKSKLLSSDERNERRSKVSIWIHKMKETIKGVPSES